MLATLGQDNHALAVQIASVPDSMRGFGHIKEKNVKAAKEREASLLAAYRNPATQSVSSRVTGHPRLRKGLGKDATASRVRSAPAKGRAHGNTAQL